jgi:hypothetical protein
MSFDHIIFAGVDISSGRMPVTLAALDADLKVLALQKWGIPETISYLKEYKSVLLAVSSTAQKREHIKYSGFKEKIAQAGFEPFSMKSNTLQWIEMDAQDCFRALVGQKPLPRRSLEGQIQRALILYDEGLQINDPMDFFEEITRHKLIQGILPLENIYSSKQLDALVAAYLAWMTTNRSGQIEMAMENVVRPRGQTRSNSVS